MHDDRRGVAALSRPATPGGPRRAGTLRTGTSGFAYAAWVPAFYPTGTRGEALLPAYAAQLDAVELSATYYRHPSAEQAATWASRVPPPFRFAVKLLRSGTTRAYAADPAGTLPWLADPLVAFGEQLGTALLRIPAGQARDDVRLGRLLDAWPSGLPLAVELQDPSWHVDETHVLLRSAGATLVVTDTDEAPDPPLTVTGAFLYVRLRRTAYGTADLDDWAARLEPFLADGRDAYVFFRHDERGAAPALARAFAERLHPYRPDR